MYPQKNQNPARQFKVASFQFLFLPGFLLVIINSSTPRMLKHGLDANAPLNIAIEHLADKVNTLLTHYIRDSKVVVHNLVDGVERVLFVDDGVEQDAESPDVLFFAAVR